MKKVVISGGPGCGKTTTINYLSRMGYYTVPEVLQTIKNEARGLIEELYNTNKLAFEETIFNMQLELENKIPSDKDIVFLERCCGDIIAYLKVFGLPVPQRMLDLSRNRYNQAFILDLIKECKLSGRRGYKREEIHEELINTYEMLGYAPIIVPEMPVKERVNFILEKIIGKL